MTEVRDMLFVCKVFQITELGQQETGSRIVGMVRGKLLEPGGHGAEPPRLENWLLGTNSVHLSGPTKPRLALEIHGASAVL